MEDLTETTLTETALRQMADTPDPRLREIMACAVKHLHAFAREVSLTPDEWLYGIKFMTEVGQACTPYRQEFILLSDTLGLSRMINILHDGRADQKGGRAGTETSLLGPFYRERSPELAPGDLITVNPKGEQIVVFGRVTKPDGQPAAGASVEVWQTDPEGAYDLQGNDPSVMDLRATFRADADGRYFFRTTLPFGYTIPMDGPVGRMVRAQNRHGCRPAHIHFLISASGLRELVTSVYFADDPYIDTDVVFGVSNSLIVSPRADVAGSPIAGLRAVAFDFVLPEAPADGSGRVGADPASLIAAAD